MNNNKRTTEITKESIRNYKGKTLEGSVRLLGVNEIVQYFNKMGIKLLEDDILNPPPFRVQMLYEILIETILPWRLKPLKEQREKAVKIFQNNVTGHEMADLIPLYQEFDHFLKDLGYKDLRIIDLTSPTSEKTHEILSVVTHYLLFRQKNIHVFIPLAEQAIIEANKTEKLIAERERLKKIKNEKEVRSESELSEIQVWDEKNQELEAELRELHEEGNELVWTLNELKKERHELKDNLQSVQYTIIRDLQEHKLLSNYEQIDVEKYKQEIQELKQLIEKHNQETAALQDTIPGITEKLLVAKSQSQDVTQCKRMIENINFTIGDSNRHKKTNDAIKREISNCEKVFKDFSTKLSKARTQKALYNSKIEKLKIQQEKKRESMSLYLKSHKEVSSKAEAEITEFQKLKEECERDIDHVQTQIDTLLKEHKNEMDKIYVAIKKLLESAKKRCEEGERTLSLISE